MRRFALVSASMLAMVIAAGRASANDKPAIAPPEAWVKPRPLPADDGKSDGQAVRLLLQDQQIAVTPDGVTNYNEIVVKIQTPQGLSAGNISLPWDPDADTLTVHKIHVLRAGKAIDVLASGQSFTVLRRETNLESAMLDGMLTANIQPEGLQVGDVIDFAASVKHTDPALKGHVESAAMLVAPSAMSTMRIQWPNASPMRWQTTDDIPKPALSKAGGLVTLSLSADNASAVVLPKGAPARFALSREIEFTDFRSWADLATRMAPLYDKASALPADGALQKEVARIKALSPDPKARAEAALALVQNQVRYVYLGMHSGNLVPANAETTWSRRFGDCKGKTALLLALLRSLGIVADPVVVNAINGDGIDQRLPMVQLFNHVLVRATVAGRTYWLDGTRLGDRDLDGIETPAFQWGLPLLASGATLVPIVRSAYDAPRTVTSVRIDASAGLSLPAPAHVEQRIVGDGATAYHLAIENLTPEARDRGLRAFWRNRYNFITPTAVSARYDDKTGEETLSLDGTATMDWSDGRYETDGMGIGYAADFTREPGPHHDAPFAVAFPSFDQYRETIVLPNKGEGFKLDTPGFDRTLAGVHYHRTGSLIDGVVTLDETERAVTPEISFVDATAAQAELRALGKQGLFVRRPNTYAPTSQELAALDGKTPTSAAEYVTRGMARFARQNADGAIEDFSKAIALNPKNGAALAERGNCYAQIRKNDLALADVRAALALDPRNVVAIGTRGTVAGNSGRYRDAVADFSTVLEIVPGDSYSQGRRAMAEAKLKDSEHALADSAAALHGLPHWNDLYLLRANLLLSQGKIDAVVAESKAIVAASPDDPYAHRIAGAIYFGLGRKADAYREFDREIAIKPSPSAFLYRMDARPDQDLAAKRADLEAARKLGPTDQGVMVADAKMRGKAGDYAGSIAMLTEALKPTPTNAMLLVRRGIAHAHLGQTALAEQDYEAARRNGGSMVQLNSMCWEKATENVSLTSALADCDASLAKAKEAPTLDSRGFVLLRLARYDEAIASYDQSLALRPEQASSLYGRAIAEARKGDTSKAEADRAEALKVNPNVSNEYSGYGVTW